MTTAPSHRASLLAGLRTGGVRSASTTIPHTAAPGASFNIHRLSTQDFPDEESDVLTDIPSHNVYGGVDRQVPVTSAVDGQNNRFSQQQSASQRGLNVNSLPFSPAFGTNMSTDAQTLQMQFMQMEILRLQTIQAQQQYQAELINQAQRLQQQQQAKNRRSSLGLVPPATAGPLTNSFGTSAEVRRPNHAELLKAQLGIAGDDQVPMTASLGGKFGSRALSSNAAGRFGVESDDMVPPPTPGNTTVISGGTSLGNSNSTNAAPAAVSLSKSDSASSWRRGGRNNSVLSGNRAASISSSPSVRVTPPVERLSPPPASGLKSRPQPLHFNIVASQAIGVVALDTDATDTTDGEDNYSTASSRSGNSPSSPTTPHSASSNEVPLSPREEAAKKLYEGLGIGRPFVANVQAPVPSVVSYRLASQPMRQPRGPPSGADELGPKNFATRIRMKSVGALLGARERREVVEAY